VSSLCSDPSYPKPGISLSPEGRVETGTNVTIRCRNRDYGGATFLHKDGRSAPIQHQDPDVGGTAAFTLFGVTPEDSGTYRCSYRIGGCCFLSSPLGDSVTLEVAPAPPGDSGALRWTPLWTVVGGCAAAFVFTLIFIVFFLLAAHRRRTQRNGSPGGEGVT
ncbi:IGSF1 protein, partial [Odontophorus gujanensis]|nr:IGSF1 protein [Odontophorus gujanensis]